ncbi:alpha/beta fold hydrolase [Mycolicibacterium sp. Dal123E01]|uniref:alpha/beta fold hydrolase n=1 Tax=Mycolicibacterium sp. Dal123E01 TaxID=3457578 RepID=UPI00403EDE49
MTEHQQSQQFLDAQATVIVVHGAWADGSSWAKVIAGLQRASVPVVAAPIPLTSVDDDVSAVDRLIDRVDGPVVLAAHAYAGAVIGATAHPRVRALVYIAALAPDEGETVADVFYREPSHPDAPQLTADRDGYIWLPAEAFATAFAHDANPEEQALLAAVQRPIHVDCIQKRVARPRWRTLPSWYLIAEDDRMINPATQIFLAERMGAQKFSQPAGHAPLITQPGSVIEAITAATNSVTTTVRDVGLD